MAAAARADTRSPYGSGSATKALAGASAAIVFWGVSFVATKAVVRELSPASLVFMRAALGSLLLLGLQLVRRQPVVPPRDSWRALAVLGFVGIAFHQMLQAYALRLTTAVNAGWLIGLTPVWSALFAAVALRETIGAQKLGGLALGFAGAALVVGGESAAALLTLPKTRGDMMILASTLNWALYSVLGHGTLRRLGPLAATAGAMAAGALFTLPLFAGWGGWRELAALSFAGWLSVLYLGLVCSGLGYLFWYGALEQIEASRVSALLYAEPLVTQVAAALLLGESTPVTTLAGGVMLLAGVWIVQRAGR